MAIFCNGAIEAYVGPTELGAKDNLEEVIISFITGAKKTLDIAVQEIDSEPIAQAIIDARYRKVSVRIIVEQDYLLSDELPELKPNVGESEADAKHRIQWSESKTKGTQTNRDILAALLRNAIDVKADYNPEIFHQKFIIRDAESKKNTSALLTGSTNFTHTCTHTNLNHIIIFNDYRVCETYKDEYADIWSGTFGALRERRRKEPIKINIGGVPVRALFSPDDSPELEIIKQMLKCEKKLDFAIFTFAGSSGIDDAMTILREANKNITGVLDPTQGKQWWAATEWLHNKGIKVYFPKKIKGFRKLHHKLMVIDEAIVIAGSMNYTAPANLYNDENIVVLGSPYQDLKPKDGGPVDKNACAEIARYFKKEIDRIITSSEEYKTG